jgi:hypothetical protein
MNPSPTPTSTSTSTPTSTEQAPSLAGRTALLVLTAAGLLLASAAGGAASSVQAAEGQAPLTVTAKLVEVPTQFPPDDLYDYAYVMRYQVIGGPMDKQFILVAHYKPRQPRSKITDAMKAEVSGKLRSFKVGDTHKLVLSPDLKKIWKGALVDEFASTDRRSIRYWALSADPA